MTKLEHIHSYINAHPGCTNRAIADALNMNPSAVASSTLHLCNGGRITRIETGRSITNRPTYGYYPKGSTPNAVVPVSVSSPKLRKAKDLDTSLDTMVNQLASAFAKRVADAVTVKLATELEAVFARTLSGGTEDTEEANVALEKIKDRLADSVNASKPEAKSFLPVVGVVGLLPTQMGEISSEFHDCMDIRFWNNANGDGQDALKSLAQSCEVIFLHTRHASHMVDGFLKSHARKLVRVTGGVTNLKSVMMNYFAER